MKNNPRCLYNNNFIGFLTETDVSILGKLCDRYHGDAKTTTREAWKVEISVMKDALSLLSNKDGRIIFEYDIPRLGKRIDIVLLYRGIIFCLEFKVGQRAQIKEFSTRRLVRLHSVCERLESFSQGSFLFYSTIAEE